MSAMATLRSTIESLAAQFASNLIGALRGASIEELYDVTRGAGGGGVRRGPGRPPKSASATSAPARRGKGGRIRRSASDISKMVDSIADLLTKHPKGLRAEQIRNELGCNPKELPRPLADALASGRVTKTGQKRATTYFAGGAKKRGPGRPKK